MRDSEILLWQKTLAEIHGNPKANLIFWQDSLARRLGEFEKFSTLVDIKEMEKTLFELEKTHENHEDMRIVLKGQLGIAKWYLAQLENFLEDVSKENAHLSLFKEVYSTVPSRMVSKELMNVQETLAKATEDTDRPKTNVLPDNSLLG